MSTPQLSAIDLSALSNPTPGLSATNLSALSTPINPLSDINLGAIVNPTPPLNGIDLSALSAPTPGLPPDLSAIDLSALSSLTPDLNAIDLSALGASDGPGLTPDLNAIDLSALSSLTPDLSSIDLSALGTSDGPDPTPGLNAIDLSALSNPTPDLNAIDLSALGTSDGPVNAATLEFSATGVGVVPYVGQGVAALGLSASGAGYWQDVASGSAMLSLEAVGQGSWGFSGDGAPVLPLTAGGAGYQDWLSKIPPVQLQEVYRLVITGAADGLSDLHIGGISSWQATNQAGGRSSYVQAVIPAAEALLPDIQARQNGELVIQKGYKFSAGEVRYEEILRSRFDTLRPDRGQRALTVTVSGYLPGAAAFSGSRTLTGIRAISVQNAKRRVRCDIDLFLQPGMTVTAMGETFRAGYINYYVSQTDKFCEVGER